MKTFMVVFALVLAWSLLAIAAPARAELLIQDEPSASAKARDFFLIASHRPDGSCETVEVFADSLNDALRLVKERRCDSCILEDVTAKLKSNPNSPYHRMANYCPLW